MKGLPRSKKEGIIYGLFMCLFMVLVMSFLNITISNGGINSNSLIIFAQAFVPIYIIAFVVENLIARPINDLLMKKLHPEHDNSFAQVLCNGFFIATTMSIIMTIIGGLIGGESFEQVFANFFITWPRNFCAAMFCNILIAGPLSRLILSTIQKSMDKKEKAKAQAKVSDSLQGEPTTANISADNSLDTKNSNNQNINKDAPLSEISENTNTTQKVTKEIKEQDANINLTPQDIQAS